MSELGRRHTAESLAVEGLERLHEVRERSRVMLVCDRLVDGQDLLKLVLFLPWTVQRVEICTVSPLDSTGRRDLYCLLPGQYRDERFVLFLAWTVQG